MINRLAFGLWTVLMLWALMAFILIIRHNQVEHLDCDRFTTPRDQTCVVSQTP